MGSWKDEMNDAANTLQALGKKALEEAASGLKKARPILEDGLDKARNACAKAAPAIEKGARQAKSVYEKAKPTVEGGLDSMLDGLRSTYERTAPVVESTLDRAAQKVTDVCESAADAIESRVKKASPAETPEAPEDALSKDASAKSEADEAQLSDEELLEIEVEARIRQIRDARSESNIISEYISSRFGKKD